MVLTWGMFQKEFNTHVDVDFLEPLSESSDNILVISTIKRKQSQFMLATVVRFEESVL